MSNPTSSNPDYYERVAATLRGEKPDCAPFVTRLEIWYSSCVRAGTLPEAYKHPTMTPHSTIMSLFTVPVPPDFSGIDLTSLHLAVGAGQQVQTISHARRLRGVELKLTFNGDEIFHEKDPVVDFFPRLFGMIPPDRPGETCAEFITPKGTLSTRTSLSQENIDMGAVPIMKEHPIKSIEDAPAFEYIFEQAEFVPGFKKVANLQEGLGKTGFVVPMLNRLPFQQLTLDHVGEVAFFYMLADYPQVVERMITLLDKVMLEDLRQVENFNSPYIQFDDNLDGMITNPKLFARYVLPHYQQYTDILHRQGKKVGSHTDGNIKRLLAPLKDSGLDICESFSPYPLTPCTFDEAWNAWQDTGPIIWGGIPSPLLQPETTQADFETYVDHVLELARTRPMIFSIADMLLPNNMIERVKILSDKINAFTSAT